MTINYYYLCTLNTREWLVFINYLFSTIHWIPPDPWIMSSLISYKELEKWRQSEGWRSLERSYWIKNLHSKCVKNGPWQSLLSQCAPFEEEQPGASILPSTSVNAVILTMAPNTFLRLLVTYKGLLSGAHMLIACASQSSFLQSQQKPVLPTTHTICLLLTLSI